MKKRQKNNNTLGIPETLYVKETKTINSKRKPNAFEIITKNTILPLIKKYGKVLKEHGHDYNTMRMPAISIRMTIKLNSKYKSTNVIDWGEEDPYIKFAIENNTINVTSNTKNMGLSQCPQKVYFDINTLTKEKIDSFMVSIINDIITFEKDKNKT